MTNWKGAVAVITGGASGIGKAFAKALTSQGAFVLIADINPNLANQVAQECGPNAKAYTLDVRDANAFRECIESVVQQKGRIDYLFNNAGIGIAGETYEISLEAWDRIIDINLRGVIHGIVAAYPIMVKQRSGHIINTASLAGLAPGPLLTLYSMTKHAVVGMTTSLRIEGATLGVRFSVLCPSAIETPLLDSENPKDLPKVSWVPNMRRFLTALAGPPYPVDKFVVKALNAISRNVGIIVAPWRARLVWRLMRLSPTLVEKVSLGAVANERQSKP